MALKSFEWWKLKAKVHSFNYDHLFNCLLKQIQSQPLTWQQLNVFGQLWRQLAEAQIEHQDGKERLKWLNTVWLLVWDFQNHLLGSELMNRKWEKYPMLGSCVKKIPYWWQMRMGKYFFLGCTYVKFIFSIHMVWPGLIKRPPEVADDIHSFVTIVYTSSDN